MGDSEMTGVKPMPFKRKIKAKDIVNDIRKGLTDCQLMTTYGLSMKGLQGVFTKLVQAKAIMPQELFNRAPVLADDSVTVESIRMGPREKIEVTIRVSDDADPKQIGMLRDISLAGKGFEELILVEGKPELCLSPPATCSRWTVFRLRRCAAGSREGDLMGR
jgi:hypothetical protein